MTWRRRLSSLACTAAFLSAVSYTGRAAAVVYYFRASPQSGHPTPKTDYQGAWNTWHCWDFLDNGVYPDTPSTDCPYDTGEERYWVFNPFSHSYGTTQPLNVWVQGWANTGESHHFVARSYSNDGTLYSQTQFLSAYGTFDFSLGNLPVPPYGTTSVVWAVVSKGSGVSNQVRWHGVAWNYQ